MVTYEELLQEAITIKNNRLPSSNTATLVGGLLVHIVEYLSKDGKYWANLPVQNMAREDTEPVFAKIKIGDGTIAWDDENNCLVFNKGVVSESFISAFGVSQGGSEEVSGVSSIKYNSQTFRAVDGVIDISSIAISGGVSSWSDLTDKPSWIGASKPSYAFSEITGTAAFTQLPTMYWANVAVSNSSNEQTEPTFKSIKIGGGKISWNADGYFEFDNGVVSQSFISAFGVSQGGSEEVSGVSSIKYNSQTFRAVDGVIDISQINISGGVSSWNDLTDKPTWIGTTKPSYAFSEIGAKPTTISGYGITDAITAANIGSQSVFSATSVIDYGNTSKTIKIGYSGAGLDACTHLAAYATDASGNFLVKDIIPSKVVGVGSANKLATARTLWGNSFDGSASIDGNIYLNKGDGNRQVIITNGEVLFCAATGGWSMTLTARNNANTAILSGIAGAYGTGDTLQYTYYGGTYNAPKMVIKGDNVGIGTTAPSAKLDVNGLTKAQSFRSTNISIECSPNGLYTDGGSSYGKEINVFGGALYLQHRGNITSNPTADIYACVNGGNVGIGTTSPDHKLHVNGAVKAQFYGFVGTDGTTRVGYVGRGATTTDDIYLSHYGNNNIICTTNSAERLRITGDGNVGIGTSYPSTKLDVYGVIRSRAYDAIGKNNASFVFDKNGANLTGIGSINTQDTIYFGACNNTGAWVSYNQIFKFGGTIVATSEITAYSDKRLKTDIKDLDFRGALSPKSFIKDGKQSIGFIAQEVRELYPELVLGEETEDSYLSLNYGAITAVLACQTNDHERRIAYLENRVRELGNENERLKAS